MTARSDGVAFKKEGSQGHRECSKPGPLAKTGPGSRPPEGASPELAANFRCIEVSRTNFGDKN